VSLARHGQCKDEAAPGLAGGADADRCRERRRRVEQALDQVVFALDEGELPLGEWERRCVLLALEAMRDGFYDIAMFHVQSVLVAEEQRAR
jgi:hypothetical protein